MPKCEECQYLQRTSYEYGEYECEIFGENDEGGMFTENGCRYSKKTLERMASETRQAKNDYYEDFGKWYEERCSTKETCVICGTETTGDNTTTCDSNHNFVSEPCGQIVCYKCWEKQRHDSIYHDKIPDCCMNKSKMSVSDLLN